MKVSLCECAAHHLWHGCDDAHERSEGMQTIKWRSEAKQRWNLHQKSREPKANGCKLLHKCRDAVQTWSLHQKKRKKSTKESREPKANGCKQLMADARPMDGANKSAKEGT